MKTYYWRGRKNFGDLLGPLLIEKFTGIKSIWAEPNDSQLLTVGSILEHVSNDWDGIIAGSGFLHENSQFKFPNSKVLAVRGPLTASKIKRKDIVLADPGLLADELIPIQEKKYELGIVPHWSDNQLEKDGRFLKYHPKIVRVSDNPIKVITEIAQCKKIVSSSLHGIVLADALGIPRRIEIAPRMLSHPHQEGNLFKWKDYSGSIGDTLEIGVTKEIRRNKIIDKQHELFDVFEEIFNIFRNEQS